MSTFAEYRRVYDTTVTRLEAEYQRLSPQEKSRRVLGRDNPLVYSAQAITDKLGSAALSRQVVRRELDRQTARFGDVAYHTLVHIPLRRIALPAARWVFVDFTGQTGGWRYQRTEAVQRFREEIAGRPPEETCRFLSGGVVMSELLDQLLRAELARPDAAVRMQTTQLRCRFHLWVAQSRADIPEGTCVQIV